MKPRKRGRIIFLTAGILVTIVAAGWLFLLGFGDSDNIHRYSLRYWLLVPDSMRHLPLDHCTAPPRYYYSMAEGNAPLRVRRYCRTSDPATAIAHYQALLLERGYRGPEREIGPYGREHLYFHQDDHVLKLLTRAPDEFALIYVWWPP